MSSHKRRTRSRFLLCLLIPLLPGGASGAVCERMEYLMGTTALLRVWADDGETCNRAIDAGFLTLHRVDDLLSTYRYDSPLSRLNRTAHTRWVNVGTELLEPLRLAILFYEITGGAFDPTVLPLMRLWGFRGKPPHAPPIDSIQTVLLRVGMELVEVDSVLQRVRFTRPGVELDFGGIGKGVGLDRAAEALRKEEARSGYLDLGGNILVFGPDASGRVAVVEPTTEGGLFGTLPLANAAIATSGGYERYVVIEGRRYAHVLDPRSGWPVDTMLSATVLAKDGATADALSTAVYVLGAEEGGRLVERLDGTEALMIWSQDGEIVHRMTQGFQGLLMRP